MSARTRKAGGYLQRRALEAAVGAAAINARSDVVCGAPDCAYESPMCAYLLELVAWKYISPQMMQCIAMRTFMELEHAVVKCGVLSGDAKDVVENLNPKLAKFAKFGTDGSYSANTHRDLVSFLGAPKIPLTVVGIPMKLPGERLPKRVEQRILWPHNLMHSIYNMQSDAWRLRICPSSDRLEKFWGSMVNHPNMPVLEHALRRRPNFREDWRRWAIPIKLYGDGVPITGVGKSWSKSCNVYTCGSLVGVGKTHELLFMIWAIMTELIYKSSMCNLDSRRVFWKKLCWSLRGAWLGEFLPHDSDNNPYDAASVMGKLAGTLIAGGYFFVVWLLGSDLEWFYKDFATMYIQGMFRIAAGAYIDECIVVVCVPSM